MKKIITTMFLAILIIGVLPLMVFAAPENTTSVELIYPSGTGLTNETIEIDLDSSTTWGEWFTSDQYQEQKPDDLDAHYFAGWFIGDALPRGNDNPPVIDEMNSKEIADGTKLCAVFLGKYGATNAVKRFSPNYLTSRTEEEKQNLEIILPERYSGNQYLNKASAPNPSDVISLSNKIFSPAYEGDSGLDSSTYKVTKLDLTKATKLSSIGAFTFYGLNVPGDFTLPASIASVGPNAFRDFGSDGATLTIPADSKLTEASDRMFSGAKFSNLVIDSQKLSTIGVSSFAGMGNLRGDFTLPASITTAKMDSFSSMGFDGTLTIPKDSQMTVTSEQMFGGSRFSKIVIESQQLQTVGVSSFYFMNNLKSVEFYDTNITTITKQAFSTCPKLGEDSDGTVLLPKGLVKLESGSGNSAFQYCPGIKYLVFPKTVTTIGDNAFRGTGLLGAFVIPDTITTLGKGLFSMDNPPINTLYFEPTGDLTYTAPAGDQNPFANWSINKTLAIVMPNKTTHDKRMGEDAYTKYFDMQKVFTYETDVDFVLVDDTGKEIPVTKQTKLFSNNKNVGMGIQKFDFRFTKNPTQSHYEKIFPEAGEWLPDTNYTMPDPSGAIPEGYQINSDWKGWRWSTDPDSGQYVTATTAVTGAKLIMKIEPTPTYTVTYMPGEKGVFPEQTTGNLKSGVPTPAFSGTPTGEAGWEFDDWNPEPSSTVTGDAVYTAQWCEIPVDPTYTVTYAPGEKGTFPEQTTGNLKNGVPTPAFFGIPTGEAGWEFDGWNPEPLSTVTGDAVYTAQWRAAVGPVKTGALTIQKSVTGNLGDKTANFAFEITFSDGGSYKYTGSKTGMIKSGDRVLLCDGQNIVISAIPEGVAYTVRELEANQNGYTTTAQNASGAISSVTPANVVYINDKNDSPVPPQTGDNLPYIFGWLLLFSVSAAGLFMLIKKLRSR